MYYFISNYNKIMKQQTEKNVILNKKESKNKATSRQRLHQLQKEQQYLSETFKIDNFYNNQKLDISTLKNKIIEMKKKNDEPDTKQIENQNQGKKIGLKQNPQELKQMLIPLNNRIQKLFLNKKERMKINSGSNSREDQIKKRQYLRNSSAFEKTQNIGPLTTVQITSRNRENDHHKVKKKSLVENSQQFQYNILKLNDRYRSIDKNRTISNFSRNTFRHFQQETQELQHVFKSKQSFIPKIQNIGRRRNVQSNQKQKQLQKQSQKQKQKQGNFSSRLEPISFLKKKLAFIRIQSVQQLKQFQINIHSLWHIYENLSKIIQMLSYQRKSVLDQKLISQQFLSILLQYKTEVCSTKIQFLIKIIDTCLQYPHAKIVILSRLLQNLSVVYIFLQILQQILYNSKSKNKANQFNSSHLVNFVGICSNNILLIIRLITLVCAINSKIVLSEDTSNIFRTILEFQINSYRTELNSIKDTIIRIQHNNQLATMIQSKINNKMQTRQYHKGCFGKFVKGVLFDRLKQQIQVAEHKNISSNPQTKPFFEYSYFIFQYLAFHIHHQQCLGLLPKQIQTAPQPYLALPKQFTVIIDPAKVLIYEGKSKIYVRAFAEEFLKAVNQKCNIVFWNQRMPNQIDSLCDLVDIFSNTNNQIKRLYKHHCFYDYNSKGQLVLLKDIARIGCPSEKYIILDTKFINYYSYQSDHTILLPWKGEPRDSKLSVVLQFLLPLFRSGSNLHKSLKLLKPRLQQLLRVKKFKDINKVIQN